MFMAFTLVSCSGAGSSDAVPNTLLSLTAILRDATWTDGDRLAVASAGGGSALLRALQAFDGVVKAKADGLAPPAQASTSGRVPGQLEALLAAGKAVTASRC